MKRLILLPALLAGLSLPAHAEVRATGETGFNSYHVAEVDAPPAVVWKRLMTPKDWWNKDHSWTGSTDGFYIEPKVGGCFCEAIQEKNAAGKVVTVGGVEHMRVIYYHPEHVLRMQGGLGPLQSEAVFAVLTVAMAATNDGKGTKISFSYNVGGYMRQGVPGMAKAVDGVIGEQFQNLIKPFVKESDAAADPASDKKEWSLDLEKVVADGTVMIKADETGATADPSTDEPKPASKTPAKPVAKPVIKERAVPENPEESR